jgi:hypothetical protein
VCLLGEPGCGQSRLPPVEAEKQATLVIRAYKIELSNGSYGSSTDDPNVPTFARDETRYIRFAAFFTREQISANAVSDHVTVFVKIVSPSGRISQGQYRNDDEEGESPEGFSFIRTVHFPSDSSMTEVIGNWGSETPGAAYPEIGIWQIQFYYKGETIGEKSFMID